MILASSLGCKNMAVQKAPEIMKIPVLSDRDAYRFRDVFEFIKRITEPDFDVTSLGSDTMREWDAKFDEALTKIIRCE